MTQPDQLFPDTAANSGSFADFAAKTQSEWESEFRGAEVGRWGLLDILGQIPIIGDIIQIIADFLGGDIGDIGDLIGNIPIIGDIVEGLTGLANGDLGDLFGNLLPDLFGALPAGAVADVQPNKLREPTFGTGSIGANSVWTIGGVSRTSDGSGAATVVCDGTPKALRSGKTPSDTITVAPGQTFTASIFVSHEDFTATGPAIYWQVVPFTNGVPGAPTPLLTTISPTSTEDTVPVVYMPSGPDLAWPGHELSGTYVVPEGVTGVQTRLLITEEATAGTLYFDDAFAGQANTMGQELVTGLPSDISEIVTRGQLLIDTMFQSITGSSNPLNSLSDLAEAFQNMDPQKMLGAGGPASMFDSIFGVIDSIIGGATDVPGATGGSLASLTQVMNLVAADAKRGFYAYEIANVLNNTPVARGFLPTGRANYDYPSANTFVPTTQSAALSASFGLLQAMPIGVISWYGYGTSGITAFYINIRRVNPITGERTLVHHSENIVGDLQPGSAPDDAGWMFYELPTEDVIAGKATENYWVEWVPVGGTHNIRGMSFADDIKDHPVAAIPSYGTTVDYTSSPDSPTTTLAKPSAGVNAPWVEYAVALGGAADHREPQIFLLDEDGESIPIPNWCNRVDAVGVGHGGDGAGGATLGFSGRPGDPGKFAAVTWERGTHFSGGETVTFNAVVRAAKLSIPGYEVVAAGGANGDGVSLDLSPVGRGPGVFEYNGQKYVGGVDQKATGKAGADPGGAGNGGLGALFQGGGPGGKAAGWVCFRQVEVENETPGGDTTPPTPPTLISFSSVTQSTATVTISGGTD